MKSLKHDETIAESFASAHTCLANLFEANARIEHLAEQLSVIKNISLDLAVSTFGRVGQTVPGSVGDLRLLSDHEVQDEANTVYCEDSSGIRGELVNLHRVISDMADRIAGLLEEGPVWVPPVGQEVLGDGCTNYSSSQDANMGRKEGS